jgi:hypothetical protein
MCNVAVIEFFIESVEKEEFEGKRFIENHFTPDWASQAPQGQGEVGPRQRTRVLLRGRLGGPLTAGGRGPIGGGLRLTIRWFEEVLSREG